MNDENRAFLIPGSVLDASESEPIMHAEDAAISNLLQTQFNLLESRADREKKELALLRLNELLRGWMAQVNALSGIHLDPSEPTPIANSAILLCFGSYKLGVATPSGDMDTLVLVPKYVDRKVHFFGILYNMLETKSKDNEQITQLTKVDYEHSVTPLIKMEFYGVSVDMVYAAVDDVSALAGEIRASGLSNRVNLYNDSNLLSPIMDDKMQRSYNGFRNAEMILNSMFSEAERRQDSLVERRIYHFRMTLRCIKKICDLNGLKENKFGYLGGITMAMLTAKVVQLFPNYCFTQLLERFFWLFGHQWDWENWPLLIVDQMKDPNRVSSPGYPKAPISESSVTFDYFWNRDNPKLMRGGLMQAPSSVNKRFMNVITPAWPQMNSTYNVTRSTRRAIVDVFKRKYDEILLVYAKRQLRSEGLAIETWQWLFRKMNFFRSYDQFIELTIVAKSDESLFLLWKGFIEAKIRLLIDRLEQLTRHYNFDIRLWPVDYGFDDLALKPMYAEAIHRFALREKLYIGLKCTESYMEPIDLLGPVSGFVNVIHDKWKKDNGNRDPAEISLFVHLIDKEEIKLDVPQTASMANIPDPFGAGEFSNMSNGIFATQMMRTASVVSEREVMDANEALKNLLD